MKNRTGDPRQHPYGVAQALGLSVILTLLNMAPAQAGPERSASSSQTWRCATPSGQISYSQQPCATGGDLVTLKDARTRSQQRQANDNIERDAKLARRMQRERRHEERVAAKENAISLSGKGRPHVIQSTPNNHDPVPITDMTRPIRIKHKKKAAFSSTQPSLAHPLLAQ